MQMGSGAALIVERLAHEGRVQAVLSGHVLDCRLEPEGAVGGIERPGVAQVDLVLRVHELVVDGEDVQADRRQLLGHAAHEPVGVGQRADRIDHAQVVDVTAHAVRGGGVADDEEELELGTDDRLEAELADARPRPAPGRRADHRSAMSAWAGSRFDRQQATPGSQGSVTIVERSGRTIRSG